MVLKQAGTARALPLQGLWRRALRISLPTERYLAHFLPPDSPAGEWAQFCAAKLPRAKRGSFFAALFPPSGKGRFFPREKMRCEKVGCLQRGAFGRIHF